MIYRLIDTLPYNNQDEMDEVQEVRYILERLNIGHYKNIPKSIAKFRNNTVVELDLSSKDIIELPLGIFDRLSNLEELDLSRNYLTTFIEDIFHKLTKLKVLRLHQNRIETLHEYQFKGLSKLEELVFHNNNIKALPSNIFKDLHSLKALNISNNKLEHLPSSISNLTKLEWFDSTGNKLPADQQRQLIMQNRVQKFIQQLD